MILPVRSKKCGAVERSAALTKEVMSDDRDCGRNEELSEDRFRG